MDWKNNIPYPYKGYVFTNPHYIKDRNETFAKNGNGWWINDGRGWNPAADTPMQRQRKYRKEKEDDI